jgi:hypothetical protein
MDIMDIKLIEYLIPIFFIFYKIKKKEMIIFYLLLYNIYILRV